MSNVTWDEAMADCTLRVHNAVLAVVGPDADNFTVFTHARRIGLGFGAWCKLIGSDGQLEAGIGLVESRALSDDAIGAVMFDRFTVNGLKPLESGGE